MSDSTSVQGLIRFATTACAACVIALCLIRMEPRIAQASHDIADTQRLLQSDEIAFENMAELSSARRVLATRYAASLTHNTDATFLRELGHVARRHSLTIVATSFSSESRLSTRDAPLRPDVSRDFPTTKVTITLSGAYAQLLVATAELSTVSSLVRVDTLSLRREGAAVVEDVTVHAVKPQRLLGSFSQPAHEERVL